MRSYTLKLFPRTASDYELRCYEENAVTPFAQYPLSAADLNHLITTSEQGYRSAAPSLTWLGRELYRWLEDTSQGCLSQRRNAERHVALHLDGAAGLRHLPWELLHDGQTFLCADSHRLFTPVRRASEFLSHGCPLQNRYLRVLFMAASPRNTQPELDFEAEEGRILDATRSQGVELVVEESGSLAGLQRVIEDYPAGYFDVVHLTGHADVENDRAFFWLEDDYGYQQKVNADQLARAFAGRFPRLLFLSGCRTGQTPALGMPSLSESMVQAGAPAVLGWALPVGDQAATHLAETLYHKLAVGDRLDEAVAAARQGLWERRTDYWHQLRLYADPTPLTALVTAPQHPGREKFRIKPATQAFLDPEGRVRVCDRRGFVGRRRLLQSALRILRARPGDDEYRPGLLLHGMGGLGKSSLAARLCDRLAPTHDPWVWYGRLDANEVLRRFTQRLADNNARTLLADDSLGLDQRLERLFSEHLKRPLLLVFDDFEHNAQVAEIAAPGAKRFLPRTRPDGRLILESSAETALRAVLVAIRESGTDSRVIVTCRQRLSGLPLADLGLTTFLGAELEKKTQRLVAFAPNSKVAPEPRTRALEVAAGNPRLLEWLDAVLRDPQINPEALLGRIENKAAEFREDALLEGLLDQLPSDTLRTLALLTLYELPVPFEAIAALDLAPGLAERLRRLTGLGLAESLRIEGETPHTWCFASPLLAPLLEGELDATERAQALGTAAQILYRLWWEDEQEGVTEAQALEIRRLALAARDQPLAAKVTDRIATWAVNSHRYREAQRWCEEALVLGEDYPLLHTLARAEKVLGGPQVREHYERALACALEDKDLAPDKSIILAAIQHNLAELVAQQGDIPRALQLWNESLVLKEKIGDVKGKAATLSMMAGVIAQQGDIPRALQLWNESLVLLEKIGDVQGKAATLANMAWAAGQEGDGERAIELNRRALAALVQVRAWGDVVRVLGNLSDLVEPPEARACLAQALWLALRIHAPVEDSLNLCGAMLQALGGLEAEAAPLLAGAAAFLVATRGGQHPQQEQLFQHAGALLFACAQARGVGEDDFPHWLEELGLLDAARLLPALVAFLEGEVGDWLFERTWVPRLG